MPLLTLLTLNMVVIPLSEPSVSCPCWKYHKVTSSWSGKIPMYLLHPIGKASPGINIQNHSDTCFNWWTHFDTSLSPKVKWRNKNKKRFPYTACPSLAWLLLSISSIRTYTCLQSMKSHLHIIINQSPQLPLELIWEYQPLF